MNDIATRNKTNEILNKYNLTAKKNFGQNFLVDNNIVRNIVTKAEIDENTNVIEIGPGIGSLSQLLARQCKKLLCVEIDTRLKEVLEDTLSDFNNIEFIFADFLQLDLVKLINEQFESNEKIVVVANLPYYITTAILLKIFDVQEKIKIDSICAMMQKEVGQRLSAQKDTKDYNSLTILTQYYCDTKIVMKVPKKVFIPEPRVDSVVVQFTFKQPDLKPINEQFFFKVLRTLFTQRRKTILNNLNIIVNNKEQCKKYLNDLNFDAKLRAENLSLNDIIIISDYLYKEGYHD